MRNRIAQVKNIRKLQRAALSLLQRAPGVPGIGLIWGVAGHGKTTAITWLANRPEVNAVYVRATATWSATSMLATIMRELDLEPKPRCAAMVDAIVRQLARENRSLFIDEADYLLGNPRLIDTARDLHDLSTTPLILIGMKAFQRRAMQKEQLARRISQWLEFQPADIEDARVVAEELCEVRVAEELLAHVNRNVAGSIGNLVTALARIEAWARAEGKKSVDLKDWGDRHLTFSTAPKDDAARLSAVA